MLPFFRSHKTRFYVGMIVILFGGLVIWAAPVHLWNRQNQELLDLQAGSQGGKIRITASTEMVQTIKYLKCGDQEVFHIKPPDNLVGMNFDQLSKVYPDWSIEKFDTDTIEMSLTVDSFCREHANYMFIGLSGDHVTVFYGKPGPKAIIKETTQIDVGSLMPQDVAELKQGITVESREELMRTLEGLQSH